MLLADSKGASLIAAGTHASLVELRQGSELMASHVPDPASSAGPKLVDAKGVSRI